MAYAHRWLKLVGEEFRDEVTEGLLKRPRGIECTISVLGPVKDSSRGAQWLTVKIKENKSEDEEAAPDPTAMHMLWLSAEFGVVFYISGYQPDRRDAAETPPRCGRDAAALRSSCIRDARCPRRSCDASERLPPTHGAATGRRAVQRRRVPVLPCFPCTGAATSSAQSPLTPRR